MSYLRTALAAAALAVALVLGGCGGEDPSRFGDEVSAVEDAIDAGDRGAAIHALDVLRIEIAAAKQAGDLDGERSAELDALLYESRVLLDAVLPPAETTEAPPSTTEPEPPAEPTEDDKDDKDDKDEDGEDGEDDEGGPGNGRGRANGHDD